MKASIGEYVQTNKYRFKKLGIVLAAIALLIGFVPAPNTLAADSPYFPVIGSARFSNDFYAGRSNGLHYATDIIAPKHSPIISPVAGTIIYVIAPQASWGYSVGIRDPAGNRYNFIHMNNDVPGSDDGAGGEMNAYAADMKVGNDVVKGQLLGYVGDSGNAETTVPHLHFEIRDANGNPVNPYDHLIRWTTVQASSRYAPLTGETLPYWVDHKSAVNVASANITNRGKKDTITGTGEGSEPVVNIFGQDDALLGSFSAYSGGSLSGVDVAAGNLNGQAGDEIVTAPGAGAEPLIRIFTSAGQLLGQFYAFDPAFKGGVRVATGDLDGDGSDEIVVGPKTGGGPWVRVFDVFGQKQQEFAAYDPDFRGGIDVATADTTGTNAKEIVTGPGKGGGPWVRTFSPSGLKYAEFPVYDTNFTGGIRVSGGNVRSGASYPKDELMTIPDTYGESRVRLMKSTGENIRDYPYLETWWKGYYDVAAGDDQSRVATGVNRRGSMRYGPN